jgi:hypothetical protein
MTTDSFDIKTMVDSYYKACPTEYMGNLRKRFEKLYKKEKKTNKDKRRMLKIATKMSEKAELVSVSVVSLESKEDDYERDSKSEDEFSGDEGYETCEDDFVMKTDLMGRPIKAYKGVEAMSLSSAIDTIFANEDANYLLYDKNEVTGEKKASVPLEVDGTKKVPFWEVLGNRNLGRKFTKRGGKTTYVEVPYKEKVYCLEMMVGREIIIKGHMQSGKSGMIISGAVRTYVNGLSPVIILRNSVGDMRQLKTRMQEKIEDIKVKLHHLNPELKFDAKVLTGKVKAKDLLVGTPTISIILGNKQQVGNYAAIVEANPELQKKFVCFIDEVDFVDTIETHTREEMDKLRTYQHHSYGFSATLLDTLFEKNIEKGNVFCMTAPEDYKGYGSIKFEKLKKNALYGCTKATDIPEEDKNFKPFIKNFAEDNTKIIDKSIHYYGQQTTRYVLIRVTGTHEGNERAMSYVITNHSNIVVMYYSGKGMLLSLPTQTTPFVLPNGEMSVMKSITNKEGVELPVHFFKNTNPGDILLWLYENGGVESFPKIAVFAGRLAARSISFGANNYQWCRENKKIWWHLTDMYMLVSEDMNCPELLQTMGRLCVRALDNVVLTLHCTQNTITKLCKAYNSQEEMIARAKESSILGCMRDALNGVVMYSKKLPKDTSLTVRKDHKEMDLTLTDNKSEDQADGGFDYKQTYKTINYGEKTLVRKARKEQKRLVKLAEEAMGIGAEESKEETGEYLLVDRSTLSTISKKYYDTIVEHFTNEDGPGMGVDIEKSKLLYSLFGDESRKVSNTSWNWHSPDSSNSKNVSLNTMGLLFVLRDNKWYVSYKE